MPLEGGLFAERRGDSRLAELAFQKSQLESSLGEQLKGKNVKISDKIDGDISVKVQSVFHDPYRNEVMMSVLDRGEKRTLPVDRIADVFSGPRPLNKGPGGKQSGGLDVSAFTTELGKLFGKGKSTPPSRPAPKANTPITRYMLEDTRNIEQFWKEESPRAGEWKDLSDSLFQKIVQGKFVASMARNLNPVAQYLTSKVVSLDRMANVAKENALWGTKFVDNLRGWSKRVKSDDGALPPMVILDALPK